MVASRTLAAHAVRLGYDGHVVVPELSVTIPVLRSP